MEADIFLMTNIKKPRRSDGLYVYQIRCYDSKGCERTIWDREPIKAFETKNATEYQALLEALKAALKRMTKPSDLHIYTDCEFIKSGVETWSDGWIESEWKNSKGQPVANAELWKEILELLSIHRPIFHIKEKHDYLKVMESALKNN